MAMVKSGITTTTPCVVFDLDDTLYYEWRFVASGADLLVKNITRILSADTGNSPIPPPLLQLQREMTFAPIKGINHFDLLENWLSDNAPDFLPAMPEFVKLYRQHIPNIKLQHDRKELLEYLKCKGYPMAIITDGRSITQRNKFTALKLQQYISPHDVFISEEIGSDKLSSTSFQKIEEKYGNRQYIYIGDNPYKDFYIAKQRRWLTISLPFHPCAIQHPQSGDFQAAEINANKFSDILSIIENLCKDGENNF